MTRDELLAGLKTISDEIHDPEVAHIAADKLLLKFIDDKEITEAYKKIDKWYA